MSVEKPNLENEDPKKRFSELRGQLEEISQDMMHNLTFDVEKGEHKVIDEFAQEGFEAQEDRIVEDMRRIAREFMDESEYDDYFARLKRDFNLED